MNATRSSLQGRVLRANKEVYPDITPILAQLTYLDIEIEEWVDNVDHWLITVAA
mgnify:CR=1 FL=1|tara:strand:+ start:4177 stop:4338 length:162 start_codon:yes stop_codon:yes gene_type:complete